MTSKESSIVIFVIWRRGEEEGGFLSGLLGEQIGEMKPWRCRSQSFGMRGGSSSYFGEQGEEDQWWPLKILLGEQLMGEISNEVLRNRMRVESLVSG
jgi:hypothetical protein